MNPTSALFSLQNSNPLLAILWAGFTCGTLDISAALVVYGLLLGASRSASCKELPVDCSARKHSAAESPQRSWVFSATSSSHLAPRPCTS